MSKALALNTPLPTPSGWTTMGDVRPGDRLFDETGEVCLVAGISPVMHDKPCFRVEFCDGSSLIASDDHRWTVEQFHKHRGAQDRSTRTLTTREMIERGVVRNNGAARFSIVVAGALAVPPADLPMNPYVLGVWLGDGNARAPAISCGTRDLAEMTALLQAEGLLTSVEPDKSCWRIALAADRGDGTPVNRKGPHNLRGILARLGVIANKHIPAGYLRASAEQRLALLQGLMDTDGTVISNGGSFCTKHEALARQVVELVASLGLRPRISMHTAPDGYVSWQVRFHAYRDQPIFRLVRKQEKLTDRNAPGTRPWENTRRYIRAIVPVESVPVRCIAVDSASHLFLAGERMVPTHNTDAILDVIGWRLDTRPRPQLYVGPSRDFVADVFEPRLMKLFDEAPRLAGLIARGKRNKKVRKIVNGAPIRLAWAGSATSLASDQAGDVYIDEYDKMVNGRIGTGDPFTLAKARADTYADRKICVTSTPERGRIECETCPDTGLEFWKVAPPGDIESPIWLKWQAGTRHHWAWPCPHCGAFFVPRVKDLQPPHKKATAAEARRGAYIACPVNGCVIEEAHKPAMNARGVFVAPGQHVTDSGEVAGDPPDNTILSLWVSGLASPFLSWGERLEELMNARASGDPEQIQGAVNKVGECYAAVPLNAPKAETIKAKRQPYRLGEVPREVMRLVAGVDVGKADLWYVIRGFGARGASWLIDRGHLLGPTDGEDIWDDLAEALTSSYGGLHVQKAMIDSGFRPDRPDAGEAHRVYDFARRYSWLVNPTKGRATRTTPLSVAKHEVTPKGKAAKFSVDLATVDTDFFKSLVTSRIITDVGRPGSFHLPQDIDDEYCRHMISEARELVNGKPVWKAVSRQNHYWDTEALCAVAGYLLNVQRIPEGAMRDWDPDAPEPLPAGPLVPVMPEPKPVAPEPAAAPAPPVPPKAAVAAKSLRDSLADRFAARSVRVNTR